MKTWVQTLRMYVHYFSRVILRSLTYFIINCITTKVIIFYLFSFKLITNIILLFIIQVWYIAIVKSFVKFECASKLIDFSNKRCWNC